MVVLEGINDHEIDDFLGYVRGNRNLILQLIGLMDFNNCEHHNDLNGFEQRTGHAVKTDRDPEDAPQEKILS